MTRLIVHGAGGRVGARVCALALADPRCALVGALERADAPGLGAPCAAPAPAGAPPPAPAPAPPALAVRTDALADVLIDFTSDAGTRAAIDHARRARAALLVGTTALSDETRAALADYARHAPVLVAPNTSRAVALAAALVAHAARSLGDVFHIGIFEAHHAAKRDAPSGTALRLAEAARRAGARVPDDQILSLRAGDVIGEHTVRFAGPGEYLEITHRATSRDLFARGALDAAVWLAPRPPGLYRIEDSLGPGPA